VSREFFSDGETIHQSFYFRSGQAVAAFEAEGPPRARSIGSTAAKLTSAIRPICISMSSSEMGGKGEVRIVQIGKRLFSTATRMAMKLCTT
jgi:hypothetical protein